MGTISLSLPSDGQTIDSSDVNTPFNTIANEINGNLDNSNIKAGAAIDRSKIAGFTDGWENLGYAPNTITANGNRSYDVVFSSVDLTGTVSNGMRLKLPRTVTPPTQCTSLNGSTQYWNKTSSLTAISFTDDFTAGAWIKPTSYAQGIIASRFNGTSGWALRMLVDGRIELLGFKGGASNYSDVVSYQSVPLNKWTFVAASLDMSGYTGATPPAGSKVIIDGVSVPATTTRGGTNPTDLTQAGNLEIGSWNGGTSPFPGKIAQVSLYSAVISTSTLLASMNQTLSGSETSLVGAWTFNGNGNDSSANALNLTAQGSATATTTDSPMNATEYGIIMANSFSTNTTLTVQVPEGYSLPTSGGISLCSYSTQKTPYGFPGQINKWSIETIIKSQISYGVGTAGTWYNTGFNIYLPIGDWNLAYYATTAATHAGVTFLGSYITLSESSSAETDQRFRLTSTNSNASLTSAEVAVSKEAPVSQATAGTWYFIMSPINSSTTQLIQGSSGNSRIIAYNGYL